MSTNQRAGSEGNTVEIVKILVLFLMQVGLAVTRLALSCYWQRCLYSR